MSGGVRDQAGGDALGIVRVRGAASDAGIVLS